MQVELSEEQLKNLIALVDQSQFQGAHAQKIIDLKEALVLPVLEENQKKEQEKNNAK